MSVPLTRIRSLPRIADEAVRATLAPPLGVMLWCGLALALANGGLGALMALLTGTLDTSAGSLLLFGSMLVWLPLLFVLNFVVLGILAIHGAHRTVLDERPGLWQCVKTFFRPAVLGTLLIVACVVALATLFLILPGIVATLLLILTVPVMVGERIYLFEAMLRSAGLAVSDPEGRLRTLPAVRLLALFLVFFALSWLMTMVFQLPVQLLSQGIILRDALAGADPTMSSLALVNWITVPFTLITSVVSVGVYSWLFHAVGLFYRDLVERRQSPDLARAIRSLEPEAAAPAPPSAAADPTSPGPS